MPFLALYLTQARNFPSTGGGVIALCGAGPFAAGPIGGLWPMSLDGAHDADRRSRSGVRCSTSASRAPRGHIVVATPLLGFFADIFRPAQHAASPTWSRPPDRLRAYGFFYWAVNLGFAGATLFAGLIASGKLPLPLHRRRRDDARCAGSSSTCAWPGTHPERHVRRCARGPGRACLTSIGRFMIFIFAQLLVMLARAPKQLDAADRHGQHGIAPAASVG